jgi:hypothetical protein
MKPEVLVSSDAVGIFGNLEQLSQIYSKALPLLGTDQLAIEMLAWRHTLIRNKFSHPLNTQEKPVSIRGVHGPVGPTLEAPTFIEGIKTFGSNVVMADLMPALLARPDLFEPGKSGNYFLVHEPELRRKGSFEKLQAQNSGHILVENVLTPGSLAETVVGVEKLKAAGISAGIMIDLVHALKEYTQSIKTLHTLSQEQFNTVWKKVLSDSEKIMEKLPRSGFHIPIGVNGDSLPLELMQSHHWKDLAQLIQILGLNIEWLTIENQQHHALRIAQKNIPTVAERNYAVLSLLAENEVI